MTHRETPDDLLALRTAYEGRDETVKALCRRFEISERTVRRYARTYGWATRRNQRKPKAKPDSNPADRRARTVAALWGLLERQIEDASSAEGEADPEKLARRLSSLTRTLEQLLELQKQEGPQASEFEDITDTLVAIEGILGLEPGTILSVEAAPK